MAFFSWSRWLRSLLRPQTKPIQRRRTHLRLEELETRLAPAQFVWNGAAGDGKWGTGGPGGNWSGGPAPAATDVGPDDLVFQQGFGTTTLTNNLPGLKINSITFSSSFQISGDAITLGTVNPANSNSLTGQIDVNGSGVTDVLGLNNITLGGAGSPIGQQTFNIAATDTLNIDGPLAGSAGAGLTMKGGTVPSPGILILDADNSSFTGAFTISAGITQIQTATALGSSSAAQNSFADGTTVASGAQLQVSNAAGITVQEWLTLNGSGIGDTGALEAVLGTKNVWAGNIQLDSDTTFGALGTTVPLSTTDLNITGVISDLGSGHNVIKEGQGTIGFAGTNLYRGTTTINNGILQVGNSQGLGTGPGGTADDSTADDITVNSTATKAGTLQIDSATGVTIQNKLLILNGAGYNNGTVVNGDSPVLGNGALDNLAGNNTWTGTVILGSPAPNGSAATIEADGDSPYYTLTISGLVEDPYLAKTPLTKTGLGILAFSHSNTYRGTTFIIAGILEAEDSQALGQVGAQGNVFVEYDSLTGVAATLELAVDNQLDSITDTRNKKTFSNNVWIWGPGAPSPVAGVAGLGALYSASGTNTWTGNITVNDGPPENGSYLPNPTPGFWAAPMASIGVAADPNPTDTSNYLANDFSLTVTGTIVGQFLFRVKAYGGPVGWAFETGTLTKALLQKLGTGDLILPSASTEFNGEWDIDQGWVTVENSGSFGVVDPTITQSDQPTVTVEAGAAIQVYDKTGKGINLPQNFVLAGQGIGSASTSFSELNQQGAIENIGGINTITGNIVYLGQAGIGVEPTFGPSQLSLLGTQSDQASNTYLAAVSGSFEAGLPPLPPIPPGHSSGSTGAEDANIIQTGATSGTLTINYDTFDPLDNPDSFDVYYGIYGEAARSISSPPAG